MASLIAPGFEPMKIPKYLVLRRRDVARGLRSTAADYLMLTLSVALVFMVLRLTGVATVEEFFGNPEVELLANPMLRDMLLSGGSAWQGW